MVQYISVSVNGDAPEEMIAASCHITGRGLGVDVNGNPQIVRHLLPLTSRRNASGSQIFTAGLQVTIYLEPGPHGLLCSTGITNARLTALEAFVSGELVSP